MNAILLRPYQTEALEAVVDHVKRGARRLVLAIPTGGGKTIVFAHLAEYLKLTPDAKILILAHRDELVQQARAKYLTVNPLESVGIEKAGERAKSSDRVCVASVQTLRDARLAEFKARWGTPSLIVTDEAHHAIASGYENIYKFFDVRPDGDVIHVGVTATPKRSDNVGLDAAYDAVAYAISIGDLIKLKALVPLVGYRCQTKTNLDAVKTVAGDFNQKQLSTAVDTPERNARVVQAYQDITPGRKAVVFCASVDHSKNLRDMFEHAGYKAVHIDGTTDEDVRRDALADFHDGKYDVITNCAVLTEGWDEPNLEVVMIARPTKSAVLYTQMVGRGTRLAEGKTKAAVIDFVDATKKHSVISLPTLLGLPPSFNLGGRDASAVADKYAKLVATNPLMQHLVQNVSMLEKLSALSEEERMAMLVRDLMDKAKANSTYVPVDMLTPPPMPQAYDGFTYMVWTPVGEDSYRLRLKDEAVTIMADMVGHYSVTVTSKGRGSTTLATDLPDIRTAFATAELWVRDFRGDQKWMVDKNATWRKEPASEKQLAMLKKYRVSGAKAMTKHEANVALDAIMAGLKQGSIRPASRAS